MDYTAEMSGEPKRIHIVEPTLSSEAGHCHSFVESVCLAQREGEDGITVYAGSRARLPRIEGMGVRVVRYFHRRIRGPRRSSCTGSCSGDRDGSSSPRPAGRT